ncbi:MAG: hypothetical protein ACO1Q7_03970 [Gemmatimonas sp.]
MRMLAPRTGHPEITVAEDQLEYLPITVNVIAHDNDTKTIVTRWQPSAEERQRIADGEDIFVCQVNFGGGMTPMMVDAGVPKWLPPAPDGVR